MTNEKELLQVLREKQKECAALERELNQARYGKLIDAFTGAIASSNRLIPLFQDKRFNTNDARYFGEIIGRHIEELYESVDDAIGKRQEARARKSEKRKARNYITKTSSTPVAEATTQTKPADENDRAY